MNGSKFRDFQIGVTTIQQENKKKKQKHNPQLQNKQKKSNTWLLLLPNQNILLVFPHFGVKFLLRNTV